MLVPPRAMRVVVPALLAMIAAAGCSERVDLRIADGGLDGRIPVDANLDAPRFDVRYDTARCMIRATDPPGITALGIDERFITGGAGTTLFRGPLYWTGLSPAMPTWTVWGPLSMELMGAPSLEARLPWDNAGITAVDWDDVDGIVFVSSNFYWRYVHTSSLITVGHARELMPLEERTVDGLLPWEGAGITGLSLDTLRNALVISGDRYFEFAADAWVGSGHVNERFPDLPLNDGVNLWDPPGVTAYYAGDDTLGQPYRILVNGDRYWEVDASDAFRRLGLISERWPDVPAYESECP